MSERVSVCARAWVCVILGILVSERVSKCTAHQRETHGADKNARTHTDIRPHKREREGKCNIHKVLNVVVCEGLRGGDDLVQVRVHEIIHNVDIVQGIVLKGFQDVLQPHNLRIVSECECVWVCEWDRVGVYAFVRVCECI